MAVNPFNRTKTPPEPPGTRYSPNVRLSRAAARQLAPEYDQIVEEARSVHHQRLSSLPNDTQDGIIQKAKEALATQLHNEPSLTITEQIALVSSEIQMLVEDALNSQTGLPFLADEKLDVHAQKVYSEDAKAKILAGLPEELQRQRNKEKLVEYLFDRLIVKSNNNNDVSWLINALNAIFAKDFYHNEKRISDSQEKLKLLQEYKEHLVVYIHFQLLIQQQLPEAIDDSEKITIAHRLFTTYPHQGQQKVQILIEDLRRVLEQNFYLNGNEVTEPTEKIKLLVQHGRELMSHLYYWSRLLEELYRDLGVTVPSGKSDFEVKIARALQYICPSGLLTETNFLRVTSAVKNFEAINFQLDLIDSTFEKLPNEYKKPGVKSVIKTILTLEPIKLDDGAKRMAEVLNLTLGRVEAILSKKRIPGIIEDTIEERIRLVSKFNLETIELLLAEIEQEKQGQAAIRNSTLIPTRQNNAPTEQIDDRQLTIIITFLEKELLDSKLSRVKTKISNLDLITQLDLISKIAQKILDAAQQTSRTENQFKANIAKYAEKVVTKLNDSNEYLEYTTKKGVGFFNAQKAKAQIVVVMNQEQFNQKILGL